MVIASTWRKMDINKRKASSLRLCAGGSLGKEERKINWPKWRGG